MLRGLQKQNHPKVPPTKGRRNEDILADDMYRSVVRRRETNDTTEIKSVGEVPQDVEAIGLSHTFQAYED